MLTAKKVRAFSHPRKSLEGYDGCVACGDPLPAITVDLPEGDVCAVCVQKLVKKLRAENARLKKRCGHAR